ncbi:hypothetical protein [Mucilaginibacter sp. KACC 22063]|uniref:hypothetical protein n=1 Tax=Mucilaginibacter sp. KACC 22063 TaxID=3025666 RepID=UPI002366FB9F|nr:hypothetical protein [Mucilaginibacter sp. KACC 22063]WDF53461.1 hypothetical protein PQ461_10940 [Mucilaginibacter sp. KACC 22063]
MSKKAIDDLTSDFYKGISFKTGQRPDYSEVLNMFDNDGILINNSFAVPLRFTPETFVQALESQVANGNMRQFFQHEAYSKTEIFGKVAQRLSVYEYSFADHKIEHMPRGINFVQFIQVEGKWKILSMAWNDENENYIIPQEYVVV